MSKGISVFVAGVLLIAIVVSVSSIFVIWGRRFAFLTTQTTSEKTKEALKSAKSILGILRVDAQHVIIANYGATPLHNCSVYVDDEKYEVYSGPEELKPAEVGVLELADWIPAGQHTLIVTCLETRSQEIVSVSKQVVIEANVTVEA